MESYNIPDGTDLSLNLERRLPQELKINFSHEEILRMPIFTGRNMSPGDEDSKMNNISPNNISPNNISPARKKHFPDGRKQSYVAFGKSFKLAKNSSPKGTIVNYLNHQRIYIQINNKCKHLLDMMRHSY